MEKPSASNAGIGFTDIAIWLPKYTRPALCPLLGAATSVFGSPEACFVQKAYVPWLDTVPAGDPPERPHEGMAALIEVEDFVVLPETPQK